MNDNTSTLEQIIRQYVYLPSIPNAKGWYPCVHAGGCDRGHKGPRAAFNFSDQTIAFHCFNCGVKTVYDPSAHNNIPQKMKDVLNDFGVPEDEWREVQFHSLQSTQSQNKKVNKPKPRNIEPTRLQIPEPFYYINNASNNDRWAVVAREYLIHERNVDPDSYPFMLCSIKADNRFYYQWKKRLIIPIFKDGEVIFWQGRSLHDTITPKYKSPSVPKEKVLYGFDRLFEQHTKPLFVVEGWFDAFKINGVAILGNELSTEQTIWLNKTNRPKVYIPDRHSSGRDIADKCLQRGWSISTPDIGDCKDLSDAVDRYGLLYIVKSIMENIYDNSDPLTTETALTFYCNDKK